MARTPPAERRPRLAASARRAQLVEVGRMVFAERGYEATSVEEIAERAGISKPIVYEHFGGKEGLYAVVVDREVEHIVGRIVEAITVGSARERWDCHVRHRQGLRPITQKARSWNHGGSDRRAFSAILLRYQ